jgi:hypothetical protein
MRYPGCVDCYRDDLPIGAACGANRQDATFTAAALAGMVVDSPVEASAKSGPDTEPQARGNQLDRHGHLNRQSRRKLAEQFRNGSDERALPYLRGDGNFAKVPARSEAKKQGYRLWAPAQGQSRRGLGSIRSSVERAHALLNQFGRVFRRFDRQQHRYLAWVQLACCLIFMRQGFFP